MSNQLDKILFKPLNIGEFINFMRSINFPFTINKSFTADFYITPGNSINETKIYFCFPDCFTVAKHILESESTILNDIVSKKFEYTNSLVGLNYRDILIEMSHTIYINRWEYHTVLDVGESQRMISLLLDMYKYLNPKILDNEKFIFHTRFMDYLVSKKYAIRKNGITIGGKNIPIYFIHYEMLSKDSKSAVDAYVTYMKSKLNLIMDNYKNYFYRIDTSHRVLGYISPEEALKII